MQIMGFQSKQIAGSEWQGQVLTAPVIVAQVGHSLHPQVDPSEPL